MLVSNIVPFSFVPVALILKQIHSLGHKVRKKLIVEYNKQFYPDNVLLLTIPDTIGMLIMFSIFPSRD